MSYENVNLLSDAEEASSPQILISEQMSLWDMAEALASDQVLSESEHATLRSLILNKVDNCVMFRDKVLDEIERHKAYVKRHQEHAKSLANKLERFENYVGDAMKAFGFDKLPGSEFEISWGRESKETVIDQDPTPEDLENYPEFVRAKTEYAWNKKPIKEAIERNACPITGARVVVNRKPNFGIKKGTK